MPENGASLWKGGLVGHRLKSDVTKHNLCGDCWGGNCQLETLVRQHSSSE